MNFGYVRVSSTDQNPERQIAKMKELGVMDKYLFVDKACGAKLDRPQYSMLRGKLREGDLVYIDSLDRLGRNYEAVKDEWRYLTRDICCDVAALDMEGIFDSRKFRQQGDIGKFIEDMMLTTLSWVADQERKKIKARQAEGIAIARKNGKYRGRPCKPIDTAQFIRIYRYWKEGHITAAASARQLGLLPNTFYRRVREYEQEIAELDALVAAANAKQAQKNEEVLKNETL